MSVESIANAQDVNAQAIIAQEIAQQQQANSATSYDALQQATVDAFDGVQKDLADLTKNPSNAMAMNNLRLDLAALKSAEAALSGSPVPADIAMNSKIQHLMGDLETPVVSGGQSLIDAAAASTSTNLQPLTLAIDQLFQPAQSVELGQLNEDISNFNTTYPPSTP
jgi:hypothetical protein